MGKHYNPFEDIAGEADDPQERDEPGGADFQVEQVLQEREKSIQVVFADTGDVKWIPKKCIHTDSEVYEKPDEGLGAGTLIVHEWFARQEGLL